MAAGAVMELIAVAAQGNVLEVKRLAALGADVNVQNVDGRSPLHSVRIFLGESGAR